MNRKIGDLQRSTQRTTHSFEGRHLMAELYKVDHVLLNNADAMRTLLESAVEKSGATVCGYAGKRFEPEGLTLVLLLEESHAAIHTYPERGALFLDIFTCGTCQPHLALAYLAEELKAETQNVRILTRAAEQV